MADDDHSADDAPKDGIFAKLPDSRPGPRSPRRKDASDAPKAKSAAAARTKAPAKAGATQPAAAKRAAPQIKSATAAKVQPSREPSPPPPPAQRGGIEDLAWAGVAAAAEAATIGVRIAGKALDALRGSAEKR